MQHLIDAKNVPRPYKTASNLVRENTHNRQMQTNKTKYLPCHVALAKKGETLLAFQHWLNSKLFCKQSSGELFSRENFARKKNKHTPNCKKRNKTLSHDVKSFFSPLTNSVGAKSIVRSNSEFQFDKHFHGWIAHRTLIFSALNILCNVTLFFCIQSGSKFWSTDD